MFNRRTVKDSILLKVFVAAGSLFLITTIIPGLLSANNDLAVFLGTIIVLALIVSGIIYRKVILKWFGVALN